MKFFLLLICFAVSVSKGQLVGDHLFVKGNYLEFSINECGVYVSDTTQPPGYQMFFPGRLGIISDSGKDGWGVGIDCGD